MYKDSVNRWLTKSLFYEANNYKLDNALFTIGDEDITVKSKVLISLKKRFIEKNDPTGYLVSQEYLGGYTHWKALEKSSIIEYIEEWREELDIKLRSIGIKKMVDAAESGNYQAAKYLSDKGWDKRIAGRPSKEEVNRETKQQSKLKLELQDDLDRMGAKFAN